MKTHCPAPLQLQLAEKSNFASSNQQGRMCAVLKNTSDHSLKDIVLDLTDNFDKEIGSCRLPLLDSWRQADVEFTLLEMATGRHSVTVSGKCRRGADKDALKLRGEGQISFDVKGEAVEGCLVIGVKGEVDNVTDATLAGFKDVRIEGRVKNLFHIAADSPSDPPAATALRRQETSDNIGPLRSIPLYVDVKTPGCIAALEHEPPDLRRFVSEWPGKSDLVLAFGGKEQGNAHGDWVCSENGRLGSEYIVDISLPADDKRHLTLVAFDSGGGFWRFLPNGQKAGLAGQAAPPLPRSLQLPRDILKLPLAQDASDADGLRMSAPGEECLLAVLSGEPLFNPGPPPQSLADLSISADKVVAALKKLDPDSDSVALAAAQVAIDPDLR